MKKYNFDEFIERVGSNCSKYDGLKRYFGKKDLFPLWVADMDFKTPDFVVKAIKERVSHEIFGYSEIKDSLYLSIVEWYKKYYNWSINSKDILFSSGVVTSLSASIEAFTNIGDKVIIQTPVYFPFYTTIKNSSRVIVENPLKEVNGKYFIDFDDLERKIDKDCKLLFLCSPHNPIGRVWSREELIKLGDICLKNSIIIISDEIHSDLVFTKHIPIASISKELSNITLTLNSASKTFNVAALKTSYIISENRVLLDKFKKISKIWKFGGSPIGFIALESAYKNGSEWLEELVEYIEENIDFAIEYFHKYIPKIKIFKPEGTYLLWIDFRELEIDHLDIKNILLNNAKVALNDGISFGKAGEGFFRLNVALPKYRLKIALKQIIDSLI